ncbi:hypothetical protein E4U43_002990 [Claviceps pusilla]|uniref:Uncharacterized protein n=1 Tax=Claviceps pusilla TaxID=123648 RepID=A0A9P7N665_9HYPO|nr:hypothetical protein E4U43_002990 [Claviceps pusilla]
MASVPAIAQVIVIPSGNAVFNIQCDRVLWDGKGNEVAFYRDELQYLCKAYASCNGSNLGDVRDKVVSGVCTQCPKDLNTEGTAIPHCHMSPK